MVTTRKVTIKNSRTGREATFNNVISSETIHPEGTPVTILEFREGSEEYEENGEKLRLPLFEIHEEITEE